METRKKQGEAMTEKIHQLITITGAKNTGKTTLAATFEPPSALGKVAYFDAEKSANHFRSELKGRGLADFGMYIDLQERFSSLPSDDDLLDRLNKGEAPWVNQEQKNALIGYYQHILECFSVLPENQYRTLVLDTAEKFESGMAAYVEANKAKFGVTTTAYGKLWTEGVFPLYENLFQALYGRGVENLILVFHLKNVWDGSRPVPGKVAMSGKKILYRLSSLMLWLVNDSRNSNGEPAGLVLKERMGKVSAENDEWHIQQMLPPRIPTCTWKEIRRYLKSGYSVSQPSPLEMRSSQEDQMISELYSDAQLALMMADAKLQEQENTMALVQAGIMPTQSFGSPEGNEATNPVDIVTNVDKPTNRAEAIKAWKELGRPVPMLFQKLAGVEDGEIENKWESIIAEE